MKKITAGFVILHYQALKMTIECIETLFSTFDMSDKLIVVIDNKSPNGSGQALFEKYKDNKNVKVIIADANLGFAKGNNLGYKYLKENFAMDFMVVMNNDLLITQKDLFEKAKEIYSQKKFAVLGPDIYTPKAGIHQNPTHSNLYTKKDLLWLKKYYSRLAKNYPLYSKLYLIYRRIGRVLPPPIPKSPINPKRIDRSKAADNYCLHGSCYIFSNDFIKQRDHAFDPKTFMFWEEEILHYDCLTAKMLMTYSPEIKVDHLEDVSTNLVFNKDIEKEIWKSSNIVKSIDVLLKKMEEHDSIHITGGGYRHLTFMPQPSVSNYKEAA